jgi:hypothetical protein
VLPLRFNNKNNNHTNNDNMTPALVLGPLSPPGLCCPCARIHVLFLGGSRPAQFGVHAFCSAVMLSQRRYDIRPGARASVAAKPLQSSNSGGGVVFVGALIRQVCCTRCQRPRCIKARCTSGWARTFRFRADRQAGPSPPSGPRSGGHVATPQATWSRGVNSSLRSAPTCSTSPATWAVHCSCWTAPATRARNLDECSTREVNPEAR